MAEKERAGIHNHPNPLIQHKLAPLASRYRPDLEPTANYKHLRMGEALLVLVLSLSLLVEFPWLWLWL